MAVALSGRLYAAMRVKALPYRALDAPRTASSALHARPDTMGRVSLRQSAVRRAARRVRFLSSLVCLEAVGLVPTYTLDACGLVGVSTTFMLLLWAPRALRILLQNRYLHMSRGSVPTSQQ